GTAGNPTVVGSFVTNRIDPYLGSPVYQEIGGGSDIWDPEDHFHYAFTRVMGDFDVMVNVLNLVGPDFWSKAELMARQDDGTGIPQASDAHVSTMTTRTGGQNEIQVQYRDIRGGASGGIAASPVYRPTYPGWLRL